MPINNNSLFFSNATVDIAMSSSCIKGFFPRNLVQGISVAYLRKKTRSDHVTRNSLAARNNEAYGQGNRRLSRSYSLSLSLKTLDTGILLLAVFTLELEMDHPSETNLCTVAPSPTDTPSPIFSYWRRRLYTGYQKRIIHIQTVPQN